MLHLRYDRHSPVPVTPSAVPRSSGHHPSESPWARMALDLAVQIPREATRPELLAGMGVGGLFYQGGRFLGLKALFSAGRGGPSALLLARGTGLISETTAFMLASHGIRHGLGRGLKLDFSQLGREWLSLAMFLGVTRSAHWALRQAYGPPAPGQGLLPSLLKGASGQATTLAAVAGTAAAEWHWGWRDYRDPAQLLTESAALMVTFQWGGFLAYRALGHRLAPLEYQLETQARGEENHFGISQGTRFFPTPLALGAGEDTPLGSGLVFSVEGGDGGKPPRRGRRSASYQPQASGSFHKPFKAIGPGEIVRMVTDPKSGFLLRILKGDTLFQVQGPLDVRTAMDPIVRAINQVTEGYREGEGKRQIPQGRAVILLPAPDQNPSLPKQLFIRLGKDGFALTPASSPPGPGPTPPPSRTEVTEAARGDPLSQSDIAGGPDQDGEFRPPMESLLLNLNQPLLPIKTRSFLEFGRKVRQDPKEFLEGIVVQDRVVELEIPLGYSPALALKALNGLPGVRGLPEGRRVTFQWEGQEGPQVMVKRGEGFVEAIAPVASLWEGPFPESPVEIVIKPPPGSKKQPVLSDKKAGAIPVGGKGTWKARHLPPAFEDLKFLPLYLRQAAQKESPASTFRLILEGENAVDLEQLERASQERPTGVEDGTAWELLIPQNRGPEKSFLGTVTGEKIDWRAGPQDLLSRAEAQIPFTNRRVVDAAEIYLQLEALARLKKESRPNLITFQHSGYLSPEYAEALGSFVRTALHRFQVEGDRFEILDQDGKPVLQFWTQGSIWYFKTQAVTDRPDPKG